MTAQTHHSSAPAWAPRVLLIFLLLPGLLWAQTPPMLEDFNPDFSSSVDAIEEVEGKIWIGGSFHSIGGQSRYKRLVRLHANGSIDTSLTDLDVDGTVSVIKHDKLRGHIYVGGNFKYVGGQLRAKIMRLHADGRLDTSFQPLTGINLTSTLLLVSDLLIQPDGKVVIVGDFKPDDDPDTSSPLLTSPA